MSTAKTESSRLGELLVEMRLVDESVMASVLAEQRQSGRRLARILADRRILDEERMTRAVAGKLGLEAVSVEGVRIHDRVLALVPQSIAIGHGVLPIAIKRTNQIEVVYLVMADPLDTIAIGEVQRTTGRQVRVLMAKASEVDAAVSQHYGSVPPSKGPADDLTITPPAESRPRRGGQRPSSAPARATPPARPSPRPAPSAQSARPRAPAGVGARSNPGRLAIASRPPITPPAVVEPPPLMAPPATPAPVSRYPEIEDLEDQPVHSEGAVVPTTLDGGEIAESGFDDTFAGLSVPFVEPEPKDNGRPVEEWDRPVRDWEGSSSLDSVTGLASPLGGSLGMAGTPEVSDDDSEPVTAFGPIGVESRDWGSEIGDFEPAPPKPAAVASPKEANNRPPPAPAEPPSPELLATALEVPVNWEDESHPFRGPEPSEIRVGLERTAIIPAADLANAEFVPPELNKPVPATPAMAGVDDIPTTIAAIEARSSFDLKEIPDGDQQEAEIEEVALEPLGDEDVVELESEPATVRPNAGELLPIPVLEPSSLVSLIDEEDLGQDTGADELPMGGNALIQEPVTSPAASTILPSLNEPGPSRSGANAVPPPLAASSGPPPLASAGSGPPPLTSGPPPLGAGPSESGDGRESQKRVAREGSEGGAAFGGAGSAGVLSAFDGNFHAEPSPGPVGAAANPQVRPAASATDATRHATSLVAALRSGASLSSAQRAQLVLAIGRLLIDKGIISEAELLKALLE